MSTNLNKENINITTINTAKLAKEQYDNVTIGKVPRSLVPSTFKTKILVEAARQLSILDKMTEDHELNYESKGNSGRFWWSSKAKNNKRYVRTYAQNRLAGANDDAIVTDNTIVSVREAIVTLQSVVKNVPESDWEAFKKQRDSNAKKRKSHAQS